MRLCYAYTCARYREVGPVLVKFTSTVARDYWVRRNPEMRHVVAGRELSERERRVAVHPLDAEEVEFES